jgi:hypothetical protein
MAFSDDYADVLSPFINEYKTAKNEKARKAVLRNAADAVSKSANLREEETVDLPKDLKTVCLFFIFSPFLMIFMNSGHQQVYQRVY